MLSLSTQIEFTQLELQRDIDFYNFAMEKFALLKARWPQKLTGDLWECLSVEISPQITLAKLLLEGFINASSEPQWQRVKRLVVDRASRKPIPT